MSIRHVFKGGRCGQKKAIADNPRDPVLEMLAYEFLSKLHMEHVAVLADGLSYIHEFLFALVANICILVAVRLGWCVQVGVEMYRWTIIGSLCCAESLRDERKLPESVHTPQFPTVHEPLVRREYRPLIRHPEDLDEDEVQWIVVHRFTRDALADFEDALFDHGIYSCVAMGTVLLVIFAVVALLIL